MATKRRKPQLDPDLRRQLSGTASSAVGAVVRLRPTRKQDLVPAPAEARRMADDIVTRVSGELGVDASTYRMNVFPNLGYFVISGPKRLIERVIEQPEIASASAKNRSG